MKSIFKNSIIVAALLFGAASVSNAQVKVGDNPGVINAGSVLELESTDKGLLMPRVSLTNTTTWGLAGTPTAGMHVFNINTGITSTNPAYPSAINKIGEYYWDGTGWLALFVTAQRSTSITSASQTAGVNFAIPGSSGNLCNGLNCSVDLNINSSFTIANATNDILLNIVGAYAVGGGTTGGAAFYYTLAVDINSPGVFEEVNKFYVQESSSTSCTGGTVNFLAALKNLPPRTYNVRVYGTPWSNTNAGPVYIGIGTPGVAGCGLADPDKQQVIVSVSQ
jgi:hypothetical protein